MAKRRSKLELDLIRYKGIEHDKVMIDISKYNSGGNVSCGDGELFFGSNGYSSKGLTKKKEEDLLGLCIDTQELLAKITKEVAADSILEFCISKTVNGKSFPKKGQYNQTTYEGFSKLNGAKVKRKINLLNEKEFRSLTKKQVDTLVDNHNLWINKDPKGKRLIITNSNFSKYDFKNADLQGAIFVNCKISGSKFNKTNLTNVNFFDVIFKNTAFSNCNMNKVAFKQCSFCNKSTIRESDIKDSIFASVNFADGCFWGNKVIKSIFRNVDMNNCLNLCDFDYDRFEDCKLVESSLIDTTVVNCYFENTKLTYQKINNLHIEKDKFVFNIDLPAL